MLLETLFERRAHDAAVSGLRDPSDWLFGALGGRESVAGRRVNEKTALTVDGVYTCISIISDTLGSVPLDLKRRTQDGSEVARGDPRHQLVHSEPNVEMTSISWRAAVEAHILSWGNGFTWIRRDEGGRPIALWPLLPDRTRAERIDGQLIYITRLETRDGSFQEFRMPADDVLHIPGLGFDGLGGYSPIRLMREALGAAMEAQDFSSRFFVNGAQVSGIITFPGAVKDPKKTREDFNQAFKKGGALQVALMDQGADFKRIGIPPEDAQFIQTRSFQIDTVARLYRVPLQFLAKMGEATYNNAEQMGIFLVTYTLVPWLVRWEQELNRKLLLPSEDQTHFFKFNVNGLLRGALKDRFDSYQKAITTGWMTRNEARTLEDMNTLDNLDEPLLPLNMTTAGGDQPGIQDGVMINIIRSSVNRIVRMELNAIKTARQKANGNAGELRRRVDEFYSGLGPIVVEAFSASPEFAAAYVSNHHRQAVQAIETGLLDSFADLWRTTQTDKIVEAISRGACHGAESAIAYLSDR